MILSISWWRPKKVLDKLYNSNQISAQIGLIIVFSLWAMNCCVHYWLPRPFIVHYLCSLMMWIDCFWLFYKSSERCSCHLFLNIKTNTEMLEQKTSSSWTPLTIGKALRSNPSFLAGALIKFDARPAGVQLKKAPKLLTLIELTINHDVYRMTFMSYPILL